MSASAALPARSAAQRLRTTTTLGLILGAIVVSAWQTEFSVASLVLGTVDFVEFFAKLVPDWSYLPEIWGPLLETVQIAYLGTLFGALLAYPLLFYASINTAPNRVVLMVTRSVLTVLRSIPDLLFAALLAPVLSIGPLPGVVALTLFTVAVLTKLGSESVEAVDPGPLEALRAAGATRNQTIQFAVLPQVGATLTSFLLYAFEINVRASVVLGLVGAGGIGQDLLGRLNFFAYGDVSLIVLATFALVLLIDGASIWLRARLI